MLVPSENVSCNLCGADTADPVLTKHGFTIVRCRSCGLSYVTPRPDAAALLRMYADERYYRNLNASPFGYPDYLGERWLLERLVGRRRNRGLLRPVAKQFRNRRDEYQRRRHR